MDFIWRRSRTLGAIALILTVAGISMAVAPSALVHQPRSGCGMAMQPQSVRSYLFSFHEMIGNETKAGFLDETKATTSRTDISIPLYASFIPSHDLCLRSYN